MQKITPFLWFDNNLGDAVELYTSVFRNAKIVSTSKMDDARPGAKAKVFSMTFELEGQTFMGLNGGPQFKFTEAISLFVNCETQAEVDHYWSKLTANGGQESMCGWLKDPFGLSWQIIPSKLGQYLSDKDAAKSSRVMQAMMKMKKIDIAALDKAYAG